MDRCVVLVEHLQGYLLGAAASLLAGEPSRSRIMVDHAAVVDGLRERAEVETGQPLLRIYWFDGAPDRVPQPEHRRLRVMPEVTVRLGALTRSDGRWAQKGVDAAMHAELSELARNRACSDVVLVTGDGDLLPGMMSAKEHGVAVHLWAVQAADGDYNQSEDLVAEADERRVLDRAWITQAVRARDLTGTCPPRRPGPPRNRRDPLRAAARIRARRLRRAGRRSPGRLRAQRHRAPEAPGENGAAVPAPSGVKGVPTPKDLASLRGPGTAPAAPAPASAATLRWSSDKGWVERPGRRRRAPDTASLPTLAQLTSAEQRWADREEDITTVGGDPYEVGQVFARRWIDRLPDPRTSSSSPRSTRASRTASTVNCCATPPGSACSRTRTTRSTSTTGTRSGPASGGRSTLRAAAEARRPASSSRRRHKRGGLMAAPGAGGSVRPAGRA